MNDNHDTSVEMLEMNSICKNTAFLFKVRIDCTRLTVIFLKKTLLITYTDAIVKFPIFSKISSFKGDFRKMTLNDLGLEI